ncbi:neprilysin-2-like [Microplitis mediator]|uniref:neprilysin-2-like n=1 Tax=Microplitis mediator TaxID=375433 RepID=UPI002552DDE4|nr:neprilysin-2-like [Microplitis mediator]
MPYAFRLVKTLYKSCMDEPVIEEQGLTPLLSIIKKLGGWPVLEGDTWNDHESDWTTIIFKLRDLGYDSNNLIDFSINVDPKNSSKRVIYLDDPIHDERRLPLLSGFRKNIAKEYYRYIIDTAVILGAERKRAQYELRDALEFEMNLAKMSLSEIFREDNATSMYNPITVAELLNKHPSIPWKEYFNRFLAPYYKFDDIDVVMVRSPYFFSYFEDLMKSTPKRVQANYLIWHTVASSVKYLNDGIRERQLEYNKDLYHETERRPRWKECVETVSNTLPISTGAMYVRDYFSKDARETARKITLDVRDQFIKTLQTVDWMNEETRKHALDKAKSITINIGIHH